MPFGPGNNANPNGRPKKGQTLTDLLRFELAKKGPDGQTNRAAVLASLIGMARNGNIEAIKVIFDRMDGKVAQPIEHAGPGGGQIPHKHDFDFAGFAALFAGAVRPELAAPDPDRVIESVHPAYADAETSLLPDPPG